MVIYMVHFHDYDDEYSLGYFINKKDAEVCAEYYNRVKPSNYFDDAYEIEQYNLDDTNYLSLIKELDEMEKAAIEAEQEALKQRELAELSRLKAKYEQ